MSKFTQLKDKLRNQFSSELMWRSFLALQGLFLVIMISLADHYVDSDGEWYFMFPILDYERPDRIFSFWVPFLFYLLVPFIVIKVIDWVLQSRTND